jgi:hypothetical protein
MMSALEKAKALREFRQLRDQLADVGLKPLEKIKALKRFRELRGMLGETAVVPFDTSEFAGPGDISGATFYVKNPQNGADVPVASIEEAAAKYKEFMQRTNADRPAGMDVYSAETFQPVANIKADGSWTKVETREEAQARAEEAVAMLAAASTPALADTSLLTGIISGQIDTFKDKAKLQELSDSLAKAGGDDMPAGEVRDLFEKAIRAAGVHVLTGFGYLEAAA